MRTILVTPDSALSQDLANTLAEFPEIDVVRQAVYPELEDFLRILRARRPDCVFIGSDDLDRFEALARTVDDFMPEVPVIGVGAQTERDLMPKLMHLGVREYLATPVTHEKISEVLTSVARRLAKHPIPVVRLGDLYAFLPAKPGVGCSTLAVSTSCALAHDLGVHTLLLDCDLMAGVTKFLLKLGNSSSIINALEHVDRLDEDLWSQMVGNWDGLNVLHAGELSPPQDLNSTSLEVLLGFARAQYEAVCADLPSSLDPFTVQVLREARRIFLVTTPEIVPLHFAADRLKHLQELGLGEKISLLLNRKNPGRYGLSDTEVQQLVGISISHQFSNDYSGVQDAILEGSPVTSHSSLGQSIMAFASSLAPTSIKPEKMSARPRRFLEFFHVPSQRDHETVWKD